MMRGYLMSPIYLLEGNWLSMDIIFEKVRFYLSKKGRLLKTGLMILIWSLKEKFYRF